MRVVLTGGPNSGKTSVLECLRVKGYPVVGEAARELLQKNGKPQCFDDLSSLQHGILKLQLKREEEVGNPELVFFDRGTLDAIAYSEQFIGRVHRELRQKAEENRYDLIVLLERLPFMPDEDRIEKGDWEAKEIHGRLERIYERTHPGKILRVPIMDYAMHRAEYIIGKVNKLQSLEKVAARILNEK